MKTLKQFIEKSKEDERKEIERAMKKYKGSIELLDPEPDKKKLSDKGGKRPTVDLKTNKRPKVGSTVKRPDQAFREAFNYDDPTRFSDKIKPKETKAQKDVARAEIEAAMKNFKGKIKKLPDFDAVKRKPLKLPPQELYYSDDTDIDVLHGEAEKLLKKAKLNLDLLTQTPSSDRKTITLLYKVKSGKDTPAKIISGLKSVFTNKKFPVDVQVGEKGFQKKEKGDGTQFEVILKATKRGNVIDYLS